MRFQADHIGAVGDILIDPNDDRDVSGLVTIRGNLQVDGTTTTVNSTVTTLDDPIITLGGDTAPASDDGKDRELSSDIMTLKQDLDSSVTTIRMQISEDTQGDSVFYMMPQILERYLQEQMQGSLQEI
ncbi:MAG: hypothetical protein CM15mV10_0380 [uncultured marine virus]|nr:MAG: hypothetical protein CM15mV10_0380 [uncultured marine virus]